MTAWPGWGQQHKSRGGQSSAGDTVRLRRVNRWSAERLGAELADLYGESCATAPAEEYLPPGRRDFLTRLFGDTCRPGFAMVIAEADGLAGCTYGFPVRSDGFWWLGFDAAVPRSIEQLTMSGGVFAITEILVRSHPQDRPLARRLQERLLTDHQAPLGAALVDRADHPTLTALRSWGWLDVGEMWRPVGPTMLRALVLPLGERTTARLEGLAEDAGTRWSG
ncbi:hypothetical protein [Streptomyces sp. NPDC001530]|uniref:hypothetical protein n=1 Tax=Streptomyces sp. NPDC001530 TaxID=3364582 RepID=UPI003682029B